MQVVTPDLAPKWDRALKWATDATDGGGIIALIGDRGTGKTQIGVELIRRACLKTSPARPGYYTRTADLFAAIRASYKAESTTEAEAIRPFLRPWLLVIDEAHERSATSDFEPRALNLILDKRYGELQPTVIIANVFGDSAEEQAQAFRQLIGETIFDRLSETGGILPCNWQSFRANGGKGGL